MEPGSEKWLSPSKPTASPKLLSTRENNENDPSQQDKMIPKFQNQNKPFAKHFMSPTISAASKAAPPRNKILSERNENSFIPDFQIPKSEKKKYDPLTNYLSPRPQYLRFNPNRRREIFTRLEKEELNDNSSSDSHSQEVINDEESVVNPENEEIDNLEGGDKNICKDYEDEEEDGEEIEEKGWCFKGVLKFVFTLIAFVFSTSYICTMNSSQQQDVWPKVKDGFFMVKRQTLEVVGVKMWETEFLKMEVGDKYDEFEESGFEADDNAGIIEDDDDVENSEVAETNGDEKWEIEESINLEAVENDVENPEVVEINGDENREIEESINMEAVENNTENSEVVKIVGGENWEIEESVEKFDNELVENDIEDSDQSEVKAESLDRSVDAKTDASVNAESFSYSALNEDNAEKIEAVESEIETEKESYEQSTAAKTDESENADKYGLEREIKGSDQELLIDDVVEKNEKVGRKNEAVIFGASLILASLAIVVYRFKKSRIASAEKSELVVIKPCKLAAAVEEKKKIEFIARPSVLDSTEEAPKKLDHFVYAPSVELIGEIVVGRESNANTYTLAGPVLAPTQMSARESSNVSSHSFGSFTTETKITKKEGGQSGERAVESTPVRRSSRLRSRAAATNINSVAAHVVKDNVLTYLMGNCVMISERSYKARLAENEDDAEEEASSAISDEVMDDPFETVDSCPIDEVVDDDEHFPLFFISSSN
ncbi:hypothetical protein PHJA_000532600 [Phtheirospermum japonicum]|uniref:Uncharacterized protein n=1 Tax=Phtheirospermum japonicum TaxID=374723 RepID=A0A830B863_9LAMI|nr:hypothetical protein PHJA_000532600 [Phtheirospermum japonicum]